MFKLTKKSKKSAARRGVLKTNHGEIQTPFFMPIATKGAVKNLSADDMQDLKAQIILSNTYHLMLRPSIDLIKKAGGLHKLMNWQGPILTDSGGFQVFSLAGTKNKSGKSLVKLTEKGVEFKSYIDGSTHFLTPERCMEIQNDFGVDIAMCLDQCVPNPCDYDGAKKAVDLTTRWARRSRKSIKSIKHALSRAEVSKVNFKLFGIVQGSVYKDLRLRSAKDLIKIGFDGYAIGGLAVGESNNEMYKVLNYLCLELPENKPRYLMGVGTPENIVEAVKLGVDMFDCVIPTREARHGRVYKFKTASRAPQLCGDYGASATDERLRVDFYETVNINNNKFKEDFNVIDEQCGCSTCRQGYTKAYLRHLFSVNENLAERLTTIHNLWFYLELMRRIRKGIEEGSL